MDIGASDPAALFANDFIPVTEPHVDIGASDPAALFANDFIPVLETWQEGGEWEGRQE